MHSNSGNLLTARRVIQAYSTLLGVHSNRLSCTNKWQLVSWLISRVCFCLLLCVQPASPVPVAAAEPADSHVWPSLGDSKDAPKKKKSPSSLDGTQGGSSSSSGKVGAQSAQQGLCATRVSSMHWRVDCC